MNNIIVECFDCHYSEEIPLSQVTYFMECHCGSTNVRCYPLDYAFVHEPDSYFEDVSLEDPVEE